MNIEELKKIQVNDNFLGEIKVERQKCVLVLVVKEPWFSMIASGEKKEEYREIKEYWSKRFNRENVYTHVLFVNGYGKSRPRVEKEIKEIIIGKPKEGWCPKEFLNKEYYIIRLR